VEEHTKPARFEQAVMPHADAAYNLARWLARDEHDAQDVVQESVLRAFRAFGQFHGADARCWLLTIVRNTCYTLLRKRGAEPTSLASDDGAEFSSPDADPQLLLLRSADNELVRAAIDALPADFREVIVLRELEGLAYKEVAQVTGLPIGTVMSRLSRARGRLHAALVQSMGEETGKPRDAALGLRTGGAP
jgi:RNA polymerase sigma factor (sigma-70 family)